MTQRSSERRAGADALRHGESATEKAIEQKRREIAHAMRTLGRRIAQGDQSELVHWIIPDLLGCAHRPFRYDPLYGGSRVPIPTEATAALIEWTELIRCCGIKSIISLMHDGDLACYSKLNRIRQRNPTLTAARYYC
jgi:hypothetical protein